MTSCRFVLPLAFGLPLALLLAGCSGGSASGSGNNPPPAPTITSVTGSCASATVPVGQTTQCNSVLQGTGSFNSAVNWSVNSVQGGNATAGTVSAAGLYTAPAAVPTPFTVTVTATSVADATKSASFNIIVAGTIASASQTVSASAGGTITLPDGSSVTIPGGLLPSDQTLVLSEVSVLPQQPPDEFVVGVGTALQLTFSNPVVPLLRVLDARADNGRTTGEAMPRGNTLSTVTFAISQERASSGLTGAIGIAAIADSTGATSFLPTNYSANGQSSSFALQSSLLGGLQNPLSSISVSAANNAFLKIPSGLPLAQELPVQVCWQPGAGASIQGTWINFSNCSSQIKNKRVLVVVHGMMSCVNTSFSPLAAYMHNLVPPLPQQPYGVIVGFDYDWTQHLMSNGDDLKLFLEQIAQQAPSSIDIVAHSEGVPVSLYAMSTMPMPDGKLIKNFFGLAGPILGTPLSEAGWDDLAIYSFAYKLDTGYCPASQAIHDLPLNTLFQSPFIQDLQKFSQKIETINQDVKASLLNTSTTIFVAGGMNPNSALWGTVGLGTINYVSGSPFGATPSDGIVGLDSALAYHSGFTVHPFPPFPTLFHTDLPTDPTVLRYIANEASQVSSPQITCFSQSSDCAGQQGTLFTFTGSGFSPTTANIQLYSQDLLGRVTPLPTLGLADSGGTISWPMPIGTQPVGAFSVFAFDSTLTLASNNVMQTVDASTAVTINISPTTVPLAPGATQSFSAVVNGTTNVALTWTTTGGTITSTGAATALYTAPAAAGTYSVVAASQADPTATATATVTVSSVSSGVTISPVSVSVPESGTQTFNDTVSGGGIIWSIQEGASGGKITSTGIYTAPSTTGTFHVVATSSANSAQSATATVKVIAATAYSILYSFPYAFESASLIQGADGSFYGTNEMIAYKIDSSGNFTQLATLSSSPDAPISPLIQASDGDFYGTLSIIGNNTTGEVFKMDAVGNVTVLHSFMSPGFASTDGAWPWAGLIQGRDGDFYGTTYAGGNTACVTNGYGVPAYGPFDYNLPSDSVGTGCGAVFRIDSSGTETVLHAFSGASDGSYPQAPLIQGTDGNFYGTTSAGGTDGYGTVFEIDPAGNFTLLHSFSLTDGDSPVAAVVQGTDGYLYGTATSMGGGEVFKIDTSGHNFTILHSFSGPDGYFPVASLIQGSDGSFYGTTWAGGDLTCGSWYYNVGSNYPYIRSGGCGTVFKMDSGGNVTVLHTFEEPQTGDGNDPYAGLLLGKDGYLYGTTFYGGTSITFGTIFRLSVP